MAPSSFTAVKTNNANGDLSLQYFTGLECGHKFCMQCWSEYLTTKIMEEGMGQVKNSPILCLYGNVDFKRKAASGSSCSFDEPTCLPPPPQKNEEAAENLHCWRFSEAPAVETEKLVTEKSRVGSCWHVLGFSFQDLRGEGKHGTPKPISDSLALWKLGGGKPVLVYSG